MFFMLTTTITIVTILVVISGTITISTTLSLSSNLKTWATETWKVLIGMNMTMNGQMKISLSLKRCLVRTNSKTFSERMQHTAITYPMKAQVKEMQQEPPLGRLLSFFVVEAFVVTTIARSKKNKSLLSSLKESSRKLTPRSQIQSFTTSPIQPLHLLILRWVWTWEWACSSQWATRTLTWCSNSNQVCILSNHNNPECNQCSSQVCTHSSQCNNLWVTKIQTWCNILWVNSLWCSHKCNSQWVNNQWCNNQWCNNKCNNID